MERQILIIGAGTFGLALAEALSAKGDAITLLDKDPFTVHRIEGKPYRFRCENAWNIPVLRDLSVPDFDVCYVTMCSDARLLVRIVEALKKAGAQTVVARAQNEMQAQALCAAGADKTVIVEKLASEALVDRLG